MDPRGLAKTLQQYAEVQAKIEHLRYHEPQLTPNRAAKTARIVPMLAVTIPVKPLIMSAVAVVGNKFIVVRSFWLDLIFNWGATF